MLLQFTILLGPADTPTSDARSILNEIETLESYHRWAIAESRAAKRLPGRDADSPFGSALVARDVSVRWLEAQTALQRRQRNMSSTYKVE